MNSLAGGGGCATSLGAAAPRRKDDAASVGQAPPPAANAFVRSRGGCATAEAAAPRAWGRLRHGLGGA